MKQYDTEQGQEDTHGVSNSPAARTVVRKTPGWAWITMIILLGLLAVTVSLGMKMQQELAAVKQELAAVKENPQQLAQEEATAVVERVGKLIVLPEGEQPTVATVTDPERLRDQPFFAKAKRGDKVLIYTNAKKAILYDPVGNKIVEAAPLNIGNP